MIKNAFFLFILLLTGCASSGSLMGKPASLGYTGPTHGDLISLPAPVSKIVVGVYSFRDQTGQYKPSATATSFSTAVTQGATSMLVQALIDSNWFIPVEREGLPNLLNERKILRALNGGKDDKPDQGQPALPPLLPATLLVEGGVIAYETNVVTGGFGAKYWGIGGSTEFRQDRVTIFLRAVDPKTGRILKSVTTSKSILSQQLNLGIFRYVSFKRLLEIETGFSTNEPPQMCVLEAIEKATLSLVIEGILDGLWSLKDPADVNDRIIKEYLEEKNKTVIRLDKNGKVVKVGRNDDADRTKGGEGEEVR